MTPFVAGNLVEETFLGIPRRVALIEKPWDDAYFGVLRRERVEVVRFSSLAPRGWPGSDFSFLEKLPDIFGLEIISPSARVSLPSVPQIRQLGRLVLECKLENVVRLDEFPNLRSCELFWSKDVSSVFECTRLEELCLWLYPMRDLSNLQSHARLRELRLLRLPNLETLKGLSGLQQLEYLMVKHAPRLRDVSEIGALPKIKELNVFACPRVKDIEPIANAKALSTVTMGRIGTIPSLRFAETMPLVEHLSMAKVVVEDLDLSFVSSMPALRSFVIAKRKGQHPTLNEIWDELEARRTALRH